MLVKKSKSSRLIMRLLLQQLGRKSSWYAVCNFTLLLLLLSVIIASHVLHLPCFRVDLAHKNSRLRRRTSGAPLRPNRPPPGPLSRKRPSRKRPSRSHRLCSRCPAASATRLRFRRTTWRRASQPDRSSPKTRLL